MNVPTLFRPILAACLLGFATATLACSAAGPNTHFGRVLAVDGQAKTLRISDMTTGETITFALNDALLTRVVGLRGQVIVRYKEGPRGQLVATDVRR